MGHDMFLVRCKIKILGKWVFENMNKVISNMYAWKSFIWYSSGRNSSKQSKNCTVLAAETNTVKVSALRSWDLGYIPEEYER